MLQQRIITALILVLFTLMALFLASNEVWQGVILMVGVIAAWEWAGFAKLPTPILKGTFAAIVFVVSNYALQIVSVQNILFFTLLVAIIMASLVRRYQMLKGQSVLRSMSAILLIGMLVISLFVVSLIKFRLEFGATILLLSMLLVWAVDTGAYFSGRRFGKHKLAEYVSPGKTWEGVLGGGGLAFILATLVLLWQSMGWQNNLLMIFALTAIALFSVFGDLFESVLKRQAHLKDSGRLLPGHGGVLDRVDSLLIAVPMMYLAWHYLANVF